jgi:hypothetical protein
MQARFKGRFSAKLIERDFPHVVEIIVPSRSVDDG